ncbi:hypothetical protein K1X76_05325 [bacterium]|nr:hypothetical protein [bacterium]
MATKTAASKTTEIGLDTGTYKVITEKSLPIVAHTGIGVVLVALSSKGTSGILSCFKPSLIFLTGPFLAELTKEGLSPEEFQFYVFGGTGESNWIKEMLSPLKLSIRYEDCGGFFSRRITLHKNAIEFNKNHITTTLP